VYIAKLYVVYFQYLAQIFDQWSASSTTRFWASLNQTTLSTFQESRKEIERAQSKLERAASHEERAKNRTRYEILQHELKDMKAQQHRFFEMLLSLGQQSRRTLVELDLKQQTISGLLEASRRITNTTTGNPSIGHVDSHILVQSIDTAPMALIETVPPTDMRVEIDERKGMERLQAELKDHLQKITTMLGGISSLEVDRDVRVRLMALLDSPTDHALWIEGPTNTVVPSQNTITAAVLASIAARDGMPCVKYFDSVNSFQSRQYPQDRLVRLQNLILCLIMQLIALVPEDKLLEVTPLRQNLDVLGFRTIAVDEALALMAALRAAIPLHLMIVIDYCQAFEMNSDPEYSRTLHKFFQPICQLGHASFQAPPVQKDQYPGPQSEKSVNPYTTKVCLTTDGYMNTLAMLRKDKILQWVEYEDEAAELGCDDTDTFG
jgi:hypothetical protein